MFARMNLGNLGFDWCFVPVAIVVGLALIWNCWDIFVSRRRAARERRDQG
jgi:hypothetical protein